MGTGTNIHLEEWLDEHVRSQSYSGPVIPPAFKDNSLELERVTGWSNRKDFIYGSDTKLPDVSPNGVTTRSVSRAYGASIRPTSQVISTDLLSSPKGFTNIQQSGAPATASKGKHSSRNMTQQNPRWQKIVDGIISDCAKPGFWQLKRLSLGLTNREMNYSVMCSILATSSIIYLDKELRANRIEIPANEGPRGRLLRIAAGYALSTVEYKPNASLTTQLQQFRELVFASLCVVLEQQTVPIAKINDIMRLCISASGTANLYRLRRGALWVNRVIAGLIKKGWGHHATELFFLCGRSVSQYGLLWESSSRSFPYFSARVEQSRESANALSDEPGWVPLCIPMIIKSLVGDVVS
ncbi:hypothetical protein M501DRAFT_1019771 [Patellaria atrata CBS 101060]|uniref:Uncharacterized protein n=1 Tax=Patellaria atrata CBS 101060 TaxID=1346257 RepID=A0A9P4S3I2_9PEZI|nr:hypothetical protein M501DRAFT_1019771 [Patellaria atrata CBS 101060]